MPTAKKKAATKKNGAAKTETKRAKFGEDMVITGLPAENPRREGSVTHTRFKEMMTFMKRKPQATVADVIAGTTYRRNDFEWDVERGVIKTKKAGKAPRAAAASDASSGAEAGA